MKQNRDHNGLLRSSIIDPTSTKLELNYAQGPLAQPATVTMPAPGGAKLLILGGLTKVEAIAGQLAAAMLQPGSLNYPPGASDASFEDHVAESAARLAEKVIAACQRQAAQPPMERKEANER